MGIDYKSYDFQIYEQLIRLQHELQRMAKCPEIEKWLKQISQEMERIKKRHFRIAVVGEFKRGKSSFINALLGQKVLPVDAMPATATVNRITYGAVPKSYLLYKDGQKQEIKIEELADYVTKLTTKSEENARKIQEAVVEYPSIFCQNYVDIIDTPGMNDDDMMNKVTVSQLDKIDLAIVAVSANLPFSDTECKFMVQLLENPEICQIIVVVTYMDTVRVKDKERVLSYLKKRIQENVLEKLNQFYNKDDPIFSKYERIFTHLQQFGISSADALEAYEYGQHELLENSGFLELNQKLPQLILSSQSNNTIQKALQAVERITQEYRNNISALSASFQALTKDIFEVKQQFAKESYELAGSLMDEGRIEEYEKINQFSAKMEEKLHKEFIHCLSSIKVLDAVVLETALGQQVATAYGQTVKEIKECLEPELKEIFIKSALCGVTKVCKRLKAVLQPFNNLFCETEQKLDMLAEKWIPDRAESGQVFGWVQWPVPKRKQLLEVDIIAYVDKAVKESFQYYCQGKKFEESNQIQRVCEQLAECLEEIVLKLYQKAKLQEKEYSCQAEVLKDKNVLEHIEQIAKECSYLKEQFASELGAEMYFYQPS